MTDSNEPKAAQEVQPRPEAPGRKMLKVMGIVFFIFGGIAFLINAIVMTRILNGSDFSRGSIFVAVSLLTINLLVSVFMGYAGAIGVSYSNNLEKAGQLWVVGLLLLIVTVISTALSVTRTGTVSLGTVIGIVLPIIYLVGAQKNLEAKKARDKQCREVQP